MNILIKAKQPYLASFFIFQMLIFTYYITYSNVRAQQTSQVPSNFSLQKEVPAYKLYKQNNEDNYVIILDLERGGEVLSWTEADPNTSNVAANPSYAPNTNTELEKREEELNEDNHRKFRRVYLTNIYGDLLAQNNRLQAAINGQFFGGGTPIVGINQRVPLAYPTYQDKNLVTVGFNLRSFGVDYTGVDANFTNVTRRFYKLLTIKNGKAKIVNYVVKRDANGQIITNCNGSEDCTSLPENGTTDFTIVGNNINLGNRENEHKTVIGLRGCLGDNSFLCSTEDTWSGCQQIVVFVGRATLEGVINTMQGFGVPFCGENGSQGNYDQLLLLDSGGSTRMRGIDRNGNTVNLVSQFENREIPQAIGFASSFSPQEVAEKLLITGISYTSPGNNTFTEITNSNDVMNFKWDCSTDIVVRIKNTSDKVIKGKLQAVMQNSIGGRAIIDDYPYVELNGQNVTPPNILGREHYQLGHPKSYTDLSEDAETTSNYYITFEPNVEYTLVFYKSHIVSPPDQGISNQVLFEVRDYMTSENAYVDGDATLGYSISKAQTLPTTNFAQITSQNACGIFVPVIDGLDYPIGNRGYASDGITPIELLEQIAEECNNLYTTVNEGNQSYRGQNNPTEAWYNIQDVGSYLGTYGGTVYNGYHSGEDWNKVGGDGGEIVYSIGNGVVVDVRDLGGLGERVIVKHRKVSGLIFFSIYTHVIPSVSIGDVVRRGDEVATIDGGVTSVSPHLHFSIMVKDELDYGSLYQGTSNGYFPSYHLMFEKGLIDPSDFIDLNRPGMDGLFNFCPSSCQEGYLFSEQSITSEAEMFSYTPVPYILNLDNQVSCEATNPNGRVNIQENLQYNERTGADISNEGFDILLSLDGGLTYTHVIARNFVGKEYLWIPPDNISTNQGKFKIQMSDYPNMFLEDENLVRINIRENSDCPAGNFVACPVLSFPICPDEAFLVKFKTSLPNTYYPLPQNYELQIFLNGSWQGVTAQYSAAEEGFQAVVPDVPAGVYQLRVRANPLPNNLGYVTEYTNTTSVTINPNPAITLSIDGTLNFCDTETRTITAIASDADSYQWLRDGSIINGATARTYRPTVSGRYSVVVTTTKGCQSESEGLDIIVVEQNDIEIAAASSTTICVDEVVNFTNNSIIRSQGSGTLIIVNTTTGSTENIAITTPDADMQYQFLEAGLYEVKYSYESDGGECLAESSVIQVTVLEAPKNPILKDQNGNSTGDCELNVVLSVDFDGQGTPLYKWLKNGVVIQGASNATYTVREAGTYQVELSTQRNGVTCSSLTNEYIVSPKAISNVSLTQTTVCLGTPIQLENNTVTPPTATSVEYLVNFGDGNVSSNPNASYSYASAGVYTISITVTTTDSNGLQCVSSQQYSVHIVETTPNFITSHVEVCENQEIQFNTTTQVDVNDNVVSQIMDFGNGQTSSIRNPRMSYPQAGTYTVRLTVNTAAGCTYSYEQEIEVKPNPEITLRLPNEICEGQSALLDANFSNTTADIIWKINGNIVSGGNGGQLPYTFGRAGIYNVEATATSYLGCETTVSETITVSPTPVVDILAPLLRGCEGDELVFENNTPLIVSSVMWKLNGNTVATSGQVYRHTFTTSGTYQITLLVDNGVCESEETVEVIISPKPIIDFTYIGACANNEIIFASQTNLSNLTYLWTLGDGTTSQLPNPRHTYDDVGSYLVELKVTNLEGCETIIRKQVVVEPRLQANFNYNFVDEVVCNPSIEFEDNSIINTSQTVLYEWDFGDGSTSFEENPIHTFREAGNYTIKLKLILPDCETEIVKRITIKPSPTAQIEGESLLCRDNTYTFSSSSLRNGGTGISNHKWKIFSGSASYTYENQNTVSFTPPTSGEWKVQLEVMNLDNCWSDTVVKILTVQPSPTLDIVIPQGVCIGQPAYILLDFEGTDIEQSSVNITTSDGASYRATDRIWHTFQSSLRDSIFVTAEGTNSYGCSYKLTKAFPALFAPVAASTLSSDIVCQEEEVIITNESFNSTTTILHWGDGVEEGINTQATHKYSQSGEYEITLIASHRNSSCSDTIRKTITVKPKTEADFIAQAGCINNQYKFIPRSLNDEPLTSFVWITDDRVFSTEREPTYRFDSAGTYIVKLVAVSGNNCTSDTITKEILVKSSIVIRVEYDSVCVGKMIQLFDRSVTQLNAGRIVRREWDFGNGYTTNLPNPSYTWTTSGEKQVHYRLFTEEGCELDTILTIRVGEVPSATFKLVKQPTSCDSRSIFTYTGKGGKFKHWYINEEFVEDRDTLILDRERGNYKIKLAVESAGGCADTLEMDYLHAPTPQPVIENLNYSDFCETGDSILVTLHPSVKVDAQHSWLLIDANGDSVATKLGDSVTFVLPRLRYEKTTYSILLVTEWIDCIGKSDSIPFEVDHQYIPQVEWRQLDGTGISNQPLEVVKMTGAFEFTNKTKDGENLSYKINFGDGDSLETNYDEFRHTFAIPTASPDNIGTNSQMGDGYSILVEVIDPYGCKHQLDTTLTTQYFERVQLSTLFLTLDGNNVNDELRLLITEGINDKYTIEEFSFRLYNSNSLIVFETQDYDFVWNGSLARNVQPLAVGDLYHYKITYRFSDGESVKKQGTFKIFLKNK